MQLIQLTSLALFAIAALGSPIKVDSTDLSARQPPTNFGVLIFPAFQALDVFGPLDVFNTLSMTRSLNLAVISAKLDPVTTWHSMPNLTGNFGESIVPTHTLDNPPSNLEVLLVPGGVGTFFSDEELNPYINFIKKTYPKLRYLITVCTGSALAARSGVLDGRRATGNKQSWDWVVAQGPKVRWVHKARWVRDGNIWTTSGVSAGIDGTFDFVRTIYGKEPALLVANTLEYEQEFDSHNDPFANIHNKTNGVMTH